MQAECNEVDMDTSKGSRMFLTYPFQDKEILIQVKVFREPILRLSHHES